MEVVDYEFFEKYKNGYILRVYVQPGASKTEFVGPYGKPIRLKLRIKAPPVEGKANTLVIQFVSELFKIKKKDIEFVRGETSRHKDVYLNIDLEQALKVLKILDINSFKLQN